jgi:hypothetical protein
VTKTGAAFCMEKTATTAAMMIMKTIVITAPPGVSQSRYRAETDSFPFRSGNSRRARVR